MTFEFIYRAERRFSLTKFGGGIVKFAGLGV